MADYRSLVIVSGVTRQLVDTDRLIAGSGITSAPSQNLAIDAPAGQSVTIGASTASSIAIGSGSAPVNIGGLLTANTIDRATAGALTIGGTNATSVAVGKAGVAVTMDGGVMTPSVGRATSGTLSLGTDANTTSVSIGSAVSPVNVGGLLTATTIDRATAGALSIGGTNATSVSVGKAGVAVTMAGGVLTNSVDQAAAGTLSIGTTTATGITIGKVGVLTTIAGDLQVNGAETVIGLSTFTGDAQFNGNVVFGNAQTDTVSFQSVIGNGTYNDIIFSQTADHAVSLIDSANDTNSRILTVRGGKGGNAVAATGKTGGQVYVRGGEGGAGAAVTYAAGVGGSVAIFGGQGGIDNGAGGAAGGGALVAGGPSTGNVAAGNATLRGGSAGSSTWYGNVRIADATTKEIHIGNHTDDPTLYIETSGDCYCDIPNWIFLGTLPNVEFYWQNEPNATVAGGYTGWYGQQGGASSGASPGGAGGLMLYRGGQGGDGSATAAGGTGGNSELRAGTGGLANGGVGGAGGIAVVSGGAGSGTAGAGGSVRIEGGNSTAAAKGTIYVGYQYTSHVYLGNAAENTPITQQGTGNFTIGGDLYLNSDDVIFGATVNSPMVTQAAPAADVAATYLTFQAQPGGAASATFGKTGGNIYLNGGTGGDGTAALGAGAGGRTFISGGGAGTNNGGGPGAGGRVEIFGGLASSVGTGTGGDVRIGGGAHGLAGGANGDVYLGYNPTANLYLGNTTDNTPITQQGTGNVTFNGQMFLGLNVTFTNAVHHEIKVADTTAVDTSGKGIWMYAGAAGAASTANALPGGAVELTGGTGGAGSATYTAGPGGNVNIDAGPAGAAAAGGGNYGGNVIVRGGNGSGTVTGGHVYLAGGNGTTDGEVWIGYQNTSLVTIGNAAENTPITQGGTGLVTLGGVVYLSNTVLRLGQTSTPAAVGNNGFLYTKDVSGIAELFWRDDTNAELQVTTNGQLNVVVPASYFTGTAREALNNGAPACLNYDGVNSGVFHADANGTGTGRQRCIGLMYAAATSGNPAYVTNAAEKATPDAVWDAVPAITDVGKPAYLSENVGKLTLTAPSTSGSVVQVVGSVSAGGTGAVKVLVQPQTPVLL